MTKRKEKEKNEGVTKRCAQKEKEYNKIKVIPAMLDCFEHRLFILIWIQGNLHRMSLSL